MGLKIPWGAIPVQVRILPRASYTAMKTIITFALLLVLPARAAVSQQATEPIRQAVMKSDLRNLVTAEEAYFADHVKYTADLSQVASFFRPRPGVVRPHITLTAAMLALTPTDRGQWLGAHKRAVYRAAG